MKRDITFRMLAYTDAAGKYTPNVKGNGNEDNFYVDDDLGDNTPSHCLADHVVKMSDCGLLMVVADGMGGMNAGEVASQIAVDTVKEYFSPGRITTDLAKDHDSRVRYMERVIVEADRRVKSDSKNNPEHKGMGSTIIMAWIAGNELSLSWCGDSRAYRYNPATGIELLSRDHSYVQELVNKNLISYEDTFEHPQGNIVTRSLGDYAKKAEPESRFFNIYDSDIIMLCSDGLSGVLRDRKTYDSDGNLIPGDTLEDVIECHHSSLDDCRNALWDAAKNADWYDNVTVVLCEIQSGAGACPVDSDSEEEVGGSVEVSEDGKKKDFTVKLGLKGLVVGICCVILLLGVTIWATSYIITGKGEKTIQLPTVPKMNVDSCKIAYLSRLDSLIEKEENAIILNKAANLRKRIIRADSTQIVSVGKELSLLVERLRDYMPEFTEPAELKEGGKQNGHEENNRITIPEENVPIGSMESENPISVPEELTEIDDTKGGE